MGGLQWAKAVRMYACNLLNRGCGRKEHEYDTLVSGNAKAQHNMGIVRQVMERHGFGNVWR